MPATRTMERPPASETFAELGKRLFSEPSPSYAPPLVMTPQMRSESDAALREYSRYTDLDALGAFHTRQAAEWGAVIAREQAAQLAELHPLQ